jgi:predicted nuclease of predicted toxin-antitoxin system
VIAVIDENLPGRLVPWLLALGWQAVHLRELGFAGQADEAI